MNHNMFPDVLENTEGEIGLTSKRTDWTITQADQTGNVVITLKNRDCYEAYYQAKHFGINVNRRFWQFWRAMPKVECADGRNSTVYY